MISSRNFSSTLQVSCIKFDPRGNYIGLFDNKKFFDKRTKNIYFEFEAVGFKNGQLQIVDAVSLSDCLKGPFNYSKESIEHIEFSHDSEYLATAGSNC